MFNKTPLLKWVRISGAAHGSGTGRSGATSLDRALSILKAAAGLPIRRDAPDDPDKENTLATVTMTVTMTLKKEGIIWSIHDRATGSPAYHRRPDGAVIKTPRGAVQVGAVQV